MMHGPVAYIHVIAALIAIASGLFIILWRKGKPVHRLMGLMYVFAMLMANVSALTIYRLTGHFGVFHVFALLSIVYTLVGLAMPIIRPRNWLAVHVQWMSWSYLSLLAAALNELLIRLPLHMNTPQRTVGVGIAIAVFITAAGLALRPGLRRVAADHSAVWKQP